jgi:HSP20 family protein
MTTPNQAHCSPTESTDATSVAVEKARTIPPRQAVSRTDTGLELWLELPGVESGAIQLDVVDQTLSLKATPLPTSELEEPTATFCEFGIHPFEDRWTLPNDIDTDGITTSHENGVLTIALPHLAPRSRTIEVVEE